MVSADKFLDVLQQKDLLPEGVLRSLRRQLAELGEPLPAAALARQLIQAGHLTPPLAKRLLATAGQGEEPAAPTTASEEKPEQKKEPDPAAQATEEGELGLVPLEEDEKKKPEKARPAATPPAKPDDDMDLDLAPLPEEESRKQKSPKGKRPKSGLIPLDDEPAGPSGLVVLGESEPAPQPAPKTSSAPQAKPKEPSKSQSAPKKPAPAQSKATSPEKARKSASRPEQKPAAPAGSLLDEELQPLDAGSAGSPLDDIMSASVLDSAAASPLAPVTSRKKKGLFSFLSRKAKPGRRKNVWDSPLLLVGGGTLLLMLIVGGVLFLTLRRESGEKLLDPAHDDYHNGLYTQAIHKYDTFLEQYPNHPGASLARVRLGMAQMRQAVDSGADWPNALATAKRSLGEIASEDDFKDAREELAAILPTIAQGLAGEARKEPTQELVDQANETLELIDKYVLKSLQNKVVLDDIRASLAISVRELARSEELDQAVAGMESAIEDGKTAEAYRIRDALIKQYPDLLTSAKLAEATAAVSLAEKAAVRTVEEEKTAETGDPPSRVLARMAFARQSLSGTAPGVKGRTVFGSLRGVVYALDAESGALLWRRETGPSANGRSPAFPPTPVTSAPESDVLLIDAGRRELVRAAARSGEVVWRHPVGLPLETHPVVARDQVLLAARAGERGRLYWIDLQSGSSSRYAELPQPIRVTPTVDVRRGRVFLVAEHSNLYVLSLDEGTCEDVVYLGHEPGGITTPPAAVANLLLVAENDRVGGAQIRVLLIEQGEEGTTIRPVQQGELDGHVDTPPAIAGRRLVVVTDRGAVDVFEISGENPDQPLAKVAERGAEGPEDLVRFSLLAGGQLWLAGDGLSRFDVQTAMGHLAPKAVSSHDQGDVFLQAPVAMDQTLYHVRYRPGLPGALVSAVDMDAGKRIWQTQVGVPPAGEPVVEGGEKLVAVNASGACYVVQVNGVKDLAIAGPPSAFVELPESEEILRPFTEVVRMPKGVMVLCGRDMARAFALAPMAEPHGLVPLALPGPLSAPPIAAGDGLLAPCSTGQVSWIDPTSGEKLVEPFQPALEPGEVLHWRRPAAIEPQDKEFLVADGARRLYHVGVKETPRPHLHALATADLRSRVVSPVAVLGKAAYAVDDGGRLLAFSIPDLKQAEVAWLKGRCDWGPAAVGQHVLLTTDAGRLLLLDDRGALVGEVPFSHGPLAGTPLSYEGGYLMASFNGAVWRVQKDAGGAWAETGCVELNLPLASGPVSAGGHLFVVGHDGTLLAIPAPDSAVSAKPQPDGPAPKPHADPKVVPPEEKAKSAAKPTAEEAEPDPTKPDSAKKKQPEP